MSERETMTAQQPSAERGGVDLKRREFARYLVKTGRVGTGDQQSQRPLCVACTMPGPSSDYHPHNPKAHR